MSASFQTCGQEQGWRVQRRRLATNPHQESPVKGLAELEHQEARTAPLGRPNCPRKCLNIQVKVEGLLGSWHWFDVRHRRYAFESLGKKHPNCSEVVLKRIVVALALMLTPLMGIAPAHSDSASSITVLAAAPRSEVFFDTGVSTNTLHYANGSNWYFSDDWSWGFAPANEPLLRAAPWRCDGGGLSTSTAGARLCWHTVGGLLRAGWRSGTDISLGEVGWPSGGEGALRQIWQSDAPTYYPFGPQSNVDSAQVEQGGWTLCFQSTYSTDGEALSVIKNQCSKRYLMLAGITGTNPWQSSPIVQMPGTDHWYSYVRGALDWADADADARSRTFRGMTGHLVTIASAREGEFVRAVSGMNNIWLDARALASDSGWQWTWLSGIDAGRVFTRCSADDVASCQISRGAFAPWSTGDPNNSSIEGFAIVANRSWGGGQWPAVIGGWGSCMATQNCAMDGYVVEYEPDQLGTGLRAWTSDKVVKPGTETDLWVAQASQNASISITGAVKASLVADANGFASTSFTATKSGIQKFAATYTTKISKNTTRYTAATQLYVPSVSGPMLKIKAGKTGKFSLQFMPPGATVSIALTDARTLSGIADAAGKATFTPTFTTKGAVNYSVTVAGVQIATGALTVL